MGRAWHRRPCDVKCAMGSCLAPQRLTSLAEHCSSLPYKYLRQTTPPSHSFWGFHGRLSRSATPHTAAPVGPRRKPERHAAGGSTGATTQCGPVHRWLSSAKYRQPICVHGRRRDAAAPPQSQKGLQAGSLPTRALLPRSAIKSACSHLFSSHARGDVTRLYRQHVREAQQPFRGPKAANFAAVAT